MKILFYIFSIMSIVGFAATSFANSACDVSSLNDDQAALAYVACLGNPDPEIRDKIAYEGLVTLLRGNRVSKRGIQDLQQKCAGYLRGDDDKGGFLKPFAALCLAEVARTDRIAPHFNEAERTDIVKIATDYMKSITDYRGFDDVDGWRHGVAHSADLLMQLSLNDHIGAEHHREMLAAIAAQLSPSGHFYTYGEPARLARPVLFMAMQGTINEDEWITWFANIVKPAPEMEKWNDAFSSNAGLAKRHNLTAFLSALHLNISNSENENLKFLRPGLSNALEQLP